MKKTFLKGVLLCGIVLTLAMTSSATTFHSIQSGDWQSSDTWVESGSPSPNDDIVIHAGHRVELNGKAYTHRGNITILAGGELIANTGNYKKGFTFAGTAFHVFGRLSLPFPAKDFSIYGNSLFWGHSSAQISISDDWIVKGNSTTFIESICVEVDDDFHIEGQQATVCGSGGISIGNGANSNTFNLIDGASDAQLCLQTNVYRGQGGQCNQVVTTGTGNQLPIAIDDQTSTHKNHPLAIDLLYLGTADYDPDPGNHLQIYSLGFDATTSDQRTQAGGQLILDDNGSPLDPSDDFVNYTPPVDFVGIDSFGYVLSDQMGGFAMAWVVINVNDALPVDLSTFTAKAVDCQILLEWTTESEWDNEYFELEHSLDGQHFEYLTTIEGAGNSSTRQYYQWRHQPIKAQQYYRIKQVDFDGQFSYSPIIVQSTDCNLQHNNDLSLKLFPNPLFDQALHIQFKSQQDIDLPLIIIDASGKIWKETMIHSEKGLQQIAFDLNGLPPGLYNIRLGRESQFLLKHDRL
ncbi:MAG: Ig-like domain-containing protein [Bacteroidota bacterium]